MTTELILTQRIFDALRDRRTTRADIIVLYSRLRDLPKPVTPVEASQLSATFESINQAIIQRWSPRSLVYIQKQAGGSCGKGTSSDGARNPGCSHGETIGPTFETICATLGLADFVLE